LLFPFSFSSFAAKIGAQNQPGGGGHKQALAELRGACSVMSSFPSFQTDDRPVRDI